MTRRMAVVIVVVAAIAPLLAHLPPSDSARQSLPQHPLFQAGTDVVMLDVAVRHDDAPVMGLAARDFEVLDNGVPQQLEYVTAETFPVDLTLVVDKSGSLGPMIDRVKSAIDKTVELMSAEDKIRIVAFDDVVSQVFDGPPADAAEALSKIEAAGATSIYDALTVSLIRPKSPGRRALVVAFTDGQDTSATTSPDQLLDVAKRAEVVLDIFFAYDERNPLGGRANFEFDQQFHILQDAAEATGGALDDMLADDHVVKAMKGALLDFKSRYLMAYTVRGVPRPGWHDITIRLTRPGEFKILARKGYSGG